MPEPRESVRLSRLLHELEVAGFHCNQLSYRRLWLGAVERRFRAHQVRGIWHFEPEDVPAIAAAYGLQLKADLPERCDTPRFPCEDAA